MHGNTNCSYSQNLSGITCVALLTIYSYSIQWYNTDDTIGDIKVTS